MKKKEYNYNKLGNKELNKILIPYFISPFISLIFVIIGCYYPLRESIFWFLFSLIFIVLFGYLKIKLNNKTKELYSRDWDDWFESKFLKK